MSIGSSPQADHSAALLVSNSIEVRSASAEPADEHEEGAPGNRGVDDRRRIELAHVAERDRCAPAPADHPAASPFDKDAASLLIPPVRNTLRRTTNLPAQRSEDTGEGARVRAGGFRGRS